MFFLSLARCPTPLVPIMPNYQSTKKKLITTNSTLYLSLSISLIYINKRESHKHRVTESQSQKAKKKKNTTGRNTESIHNHQHQFSSSLISKNTNMKHHKSTSPQGRTTQAQFLLSMNLRFSDHKVTNILLGFKGKDKSRYL